MSVLVYAENAGGLFKKSTFESVSYAYKIAQSLEEELITLSIGEVSEEELNKLAPFGASKIISVNQDEVKDFRLQVYAHVMKEVIEAEGAKTIIASNTFNGKSVASRTAAHFGGGLVVGAIDYPHLDDGFIVKKSVYSNKGFAYVKINSDIRFVTLTVNAVPGVENVENASIETRNIDIPAEKMGVEILNVDKVVGKTTLNEAELVVSAGRGLKGPENWHLIEEMANLIGASTACSKPVSDMGWRPHAEHVGQTGITIQPNLYIAIGISGAIQHLAGVSSSKVIVAINKDPEAPFFKAADYGIVGDAFEIIPKLNEKLKSLA